MIRTNKKYSIITFFLVMLLTLTLPTSIGTFAESSGNAAIIKSLRFDGEDEVSPSGGYQSVKSVDGSNAVRLQNGSGTATQYIDLGAFDMGLKSVSVAMWVKVSSSQIEVNNFCSLISNKNWDNQKNPGFMVATSYTDGTFKGGWVDFSGSGNTSSYFAKNLPNFDGYWHSVIAVFDRNSNMSYYVDGQLWQQMDISPLKNMSATGGNLFIGCDTNKKYGVTDTTFDNIEVYDGVMSAEQIANHANPILLQLEIEKVKAVYDNELKAGRMTAALRAEYTGLMAEISSGSSTGEEAKVMIQKLRELSYKMLETDEQPIVSFNAISDIHIDGADATPSNDVALYENKMKEAFNNLEEMYPKADAVLIPGDFTRNGKVMDFDKFFRLLNEHNNADNVIMSLGNHEMKGISDFNDIKNLFINGMKPSVDTSEVYFDKWIGGYHFISLSSESNAEKSEAYLSDKQLEWFESKLAENAKADTPIYVILHQPLKETFPLSTKYSVGAQDAKLKEILKKFPQTVLMSGHLHNGYTDDRAFMQNEWGYQIDLASIKQNDLANQYGNIVYRFETYSDRTVMKVVDYVNKIELYEFRKVIYHSDLSPSSDGGKIESADALNSQGEVLGAVTDNDITTGVTTVNADRSKHELILDLKSVKNISGIRYRALTQGSEILKYDIEYSYDKRTWLGFSGSCGEWESGLNFKIATFAPITARYIKLIPISSSANDENFKTSVSELSAIYGISEIEETQSFKTMIVAKGTSFSNLDLPSVVRVKLSNGLSTALDVVWKIGSYDANKVGTYVIYGELAQGSFILNNGGANAAIKIRIN